MLATRLNYGADMPSSIRFEEAEGVLTVILDRPERKNAVTRAMWRQLTETFRDAARREAVRVVVLAGAGGDFSAGADLGDPERDEDSHLGGMRLVNEAARSLHDLPKPTIAKVDGYAVGAGCNLALACDLVVASDRARFSEIFARRGLSLDFGGSWLLPRLVGLNRAKELAFFGDMVEAADAERIGLVNRVVPVDQLDDFVSEWARRLAAGPPLALSVSKALLDASMNRSMAEALEAEAQGQVVNLSAADGQEAIAAFLEKREPKFSGR